jgi:8-oxo-dGTP pyrophosphatase MutT (NUDIX family)
MHLITLTEVRDALTLTDFDVEAAQRRMAPQSRSLRRSRQKAGEPRRASVLVLLFPYGEDLAFALVRRSENERDVHSGQIGLPGGAREAGETLIQTAIRETREELGVERPIEILGQLTCLYIPPSDFEVRPVVGYVPVRPSWSPDPVEVVEVIECPLGWLLDDEHKIVEDWDYNGQTLRVPWYDVGGHRVWGATAIMLSELEQRLRRIMKSRHSR